MPTTKTFSIGRAFGIPMYVDMSFFFIGILMLVGSGNLIVGIFIALGLGVSIMAHEFGHSLMARKYGFRTRKITLSMIGGCAEMEAIPKVPSQEIMVAVAGPGVSFVLSAGFFGFACLSCVFKPVMAVFVYLSVINAILAIFNLLPGFPMDGGRVLRAWLSRKRSRQDATRIAMNVGRIFAVILACWGAFCVFSGNLGGVMSLLVSWFIWQAGWQEYMMSIYGG
jgi:Zn-dependent protease